MRHLLALLDGDVAKVYTDLGIEGYKPGFSPVVRALVASGPSSIRDLARAIGVTHSAASQKVAQMGKSGLVRLEAGADARQRIVHLTAKAQALLPLIDAEWDATQAAAAELQAELPALTEGLLAAERAVAQRPFRQRIADAARLLSAQQPAAYAGPAAEAGPAHDAGPAADAVRAVGRPDVAHATLLEIAEEEQ
jgi:DNA-binding MarR family transcriptional regulator